MWTKPLPRGKCRGLSQQTSVVIEFTATLGVMPVGKELVVAPKTLLGIHTVFGEKTSERGLLYGLGEPRSQFFLMTSWMEGYPPIPLWRHDTSRHVCWFELYLSDACPGVIRIKNLSWRRRRNQKRRSQKRSEGELISCLIAWSHRHSWDTLMLCFRCISCGEGVSSS